jgi:hypothetical protein
LTQILNVALGGEFHKINLHTIRTKEYQKV